MLRLKASPQSRICQKKTAERDGAKPYLFRADSRDLDGENIVLSLARHGLVPSGLFFLLWFITVVLLAVLLEVFRSLTPVVAIITQAIFSLLGLT